MKSKIRLIIFWISLLCPAWLNLSYAQDELSQKIIPGRSNSLEQQKKPYIILISIDGFRHDYAEKFNAKNIIEAGKNGIKAKSMMPRFPSKTFPNHYSIVTGLYPAHHGLINNRFYDPGRKEFYSFRDRKAVEDATWYGGIPIWVLAEQQRMVTASFYWVGSEAPVQGIFPTYHYHYNEKIPIDTRIQTVVDWLNLPEEKRPHLITFYFPEVDHAGHSFGADAPETERAVQFVDSAIKKLTDAVNSTGLPVNFILVSDHGMVDIDREATLNLPASLDKEKFVITGGDAIVELYAKNAEDILPAFKLLKKAEKDYKVYLKKDVPGHLHYDAESDRFDRIGDIVILSDFPKIFSFSGKAPAPGYHGYDPYAVKEMQAIFYAWGPNFKRNKTLPTIDVVQVYPLIAHILGLEYTHPIDGDIKDLKKIVR